MQAQTFTEQPHEAEDLLRVQYTFWSGDFNLLLAQELGLFKKYGVDVGRVLGTSTSDKLKSANGHEDHSSASSVGERTK